MRAHYMLAAILALSTPGSWQLAAAQNAATASVASGNAQPIIAEQAETLVKQMAAYIGSAEEFTFHADITLDHLLPSGQKLQFAATEDVALQRSGGLSIESLALLCKPLPGLRWRSERAWRTCVAAAAPRHSHN